MRVIYIYIGTSYCCSNRRSRWRFLRGLSVGDVCEFKKERCCNTNNFNARVPDSGMCNVAKAQYTNPRTLPPVPRRTVLVSIPLFKFLVVHTVNASLLMLLPLTSSFK